MTVLVQGRTVHQWLIRVRFLLEPLYSASGEAMTRFGIVGVTCLVGMGCASVEEATPDAAWDVTVTGVSTDCTQDSSGYQETFEYQVYTDGADVKIALERKMAAVNRLRLEYGVAAPFNIKARCG